MKHFNTPRPLRHFKPEEFKYPDSVDDQTLLLLDHMRDHERGIYITINSDYRPGDPKWHGKGKALDIVIWDVETRKPLPLIQQFLIASRYMWTGIGVYPFWNTPGIHVDTRPMAVSGWKALWWRDKDGNYLDIRDLRWLD